MRIRRWRSLSLLSKGLIVVALPVLPLAFLWGIVGLAMLRQSPPANPTGRSLSVRGQVARVLMTVVEADAGLREHVLTENADAAARYRVAVDRLGPMMTELDRSLIDPRTREAFGKLDGVVSEELRGLAELDGSTPAAGPGLSERAALDRSTARIDQAKAIVAVIEQRQVEVTGERNAAAQRAGRNFFWVMLAGSVGCTGAGVILAVLLVRGISRRHTVLCRNADRLARGLEPEPLPSGDDEATMLDAHFREAARQLGERDAERQAALVRLDQLNQTLRSRGDALEAANRELEAFSYSVSHDLRAPLRTIAGFSQVIQEDCADRLDEHGKDALRRVQNAATRMGRLIDDLLTLSRITRMEVQRAPVDVSATAAAIVADLAGRSPARQVEVTIAPGLSVEADPQMVPIVLENLLDNAWKYTGKTPHPRVEVGVSRDGGPPVYHVRDNGAGFEMQYAGRLFGAFQRLHADQEFSGTGVGLATVQRIVHRHGGRIWAEGAVNHGAAFYFTLEPEGRQPHDAPTNRAID